jgi:hypothetical protein
MYSQCTCSFLNTFEMYWVQLSASTCTHKILWEQVHWLLKKLYSSTMSTEYICTWHTSVNHCKSTKRAPFRWQLILSSLFSDLHTGFFVKHIVQINLFILFNIFLICTHHLSSTHCKCKCIGFTVCFYAMIDRCGKCSPLKQVIAANEGRLIRW